MGQGEIWDCGLMIEENRLGPKVQGIYHCAFLHFSFVICLRSH